MIIIIIINIKQKCGNKSKLLFTETDSLTYEIETEDVYQDFWKNKDKLDYNEYNENSQYFEKNKEESH